MIAPEWILAPSRLADPDVPDSSESLDQHNHNNGNAISERSTDPDSNPVIHGEKKKKGSGWPKRPLETLCRESGSVDQCAYQPEIDPVTNDPDSGLIQTGVDHAPPGPVLPGFIDVLASWPGLHPAWWQSDAFALQAAAAGFHGPAAPAPTPLSIAAAGPWEEIARAVLDRDFTKHPADKATLDMWEIGLRGIPDSPVCRQARGKIDTITPAKWRAKDAKAGRLLPR